MGLISLFKFNLLLNFNSLTYTVVTFRDDFATASHPVSQIFPCNTLEMVQCIIISIGSIGTVVEILVCISICSFSVMLSVSVLVKILISVHLCNALTPFSPAFPLLLFPPEMSHNRSDTDLSHEVHVDNCLLQDSGECLRVSPAYTYRDYR